jgi:hypothetical protein
MKKISFLLLAFVISNLANSQNSKITGMQI